jgi:hypothetical protein
MRSRADRNVLLVWRRARSGLACTSSSPKAQAALRGTDKHADAILPFPVMTAPQVLIVSSVWRGTRCSPR